MRNGFRRNDEQQRQHHKRAGGGAPGIVALDRLLIDVEQQEIGRVGRSALGQDEDVVDLGDDVDQPDYHDEADGRLEIGQGDVAQALPGIGAVEDRRLIGVGRNRLQPGEEEQHVVAGVLPDRQAHDRVQGDVGIAEPVRPRDREQAEVVVEQPGIGQEDEQEDRGGGDERDQHRQEEQRAEERVDAARPDERHGEAECQNEARDHGTECVKQVVGERLAEGGIGEERREIGEADIGLRTADLDLVVQGLPGDLDHRPVGEQRQQDERGSQQPEGQHRLTARAPGREPQRLRSCQSARQNRVRHRPRLCGGDGGAGRQSGEGRMTLQRRSR